MDHLDNLQIRQLDELLNAFADLRVRRPPSTGWVRTLREALGMSIRQLAERTGMSKTGVDSAEKNEARGSVQMDTLIRLADGLDCDLVYAIVPRTSLRESLEMQATKKARVMVGRVSDSMELEAQGVPEAERQQQVHELVRDYLQNRGRDFWDD